MEENKKSRKVLIITIFILIVLLLGLVGYICYDKFYQKEEPKKQVEEKLSEEEVNKLHDTLLTQSKSFGFYFEKGVTIDNIPEAEIIQYAISNYLDESNIEYGDEYQDIGICGENDKEYYFCSAYADDRSNAKEINNDKTAKMTIKKDVIASYIKEHFSTDRKFNFYDGSNIVIATTKNSGLTVVYNSRKDEYYLFAPHKGGASYNLSTKLLSYEEKNGELTIFDKVVVCSSGEGGQGCLKHLSLGDSIWDDGNLIINTSVDGEKVYDANGKKIKDGNKYFNEGSNDLYNFDAVFEDFGDQLNTYKHTFKKASDGKYCWYSSEIVNE